MIAELTLLGANACIQMRETSSKDGVNKFSFGAANMNVVDPELRSELLDRLRVMATLQQWLWQEATVIADEILDCELEAVLKRIPDLAVASSGEGSDLTEDDLDAFLDACGRMVTVQSISIDLETSSGSNSNLPAD